MAMPEKATAAIMSTIKDEGPILFVCAIYAEKLQVTSYKKPALRHR
jgi:hypothetical protein